MEKHNSHKGTPTSLIVGYGEIGRGIFEVLNDAYEGFVFKRDIEEPKEEIPKIDYLHICIPYSEKFVDIVKEYERKYDPKYTIIHSTVAPGTTRQLGHHAMHSPVRGKHPDLAGGVRTFIKFIGSNIDDLAKPDLPAHRVAEYFIGAKINVQVFTRSETTEVGKIMSTTQYGWFIVLAKEIEKVCRELGLNFTEVYTVFNKSYNEGYETMGMGQFHRPHLEPVPGPIGGHCVVQNCDLMNNNVTRLVKEFNKEYEKEEV